jgi:nucleoside phosphorylase
MFKLYKTLIHTALLCEAQPFINHFKLRKDTLKQKKYNIYTNDTIILIVSGVGKYNTTLALNFIYDNFIIKRSINIGICGCLDENIPIGTLFCTNKKLLDIKYNKLSTYDEVITSKSNIKTNLVDMEGSYFYDISLKFIRNSNILIFKVVSDYLSSKRPSKDFVSNLITKSLNKLEYYI